MTRETIYAALFAKVLLLRDQATQPIPAGKFRTVERRLRHWNDVPAEECPYIGQVQVSEVKRQARGQPPCWSFMLNWYVYVATQAQVTPGVIPAQLLNPLIDALEGVVAPDSKGRQDQVCTLGGLVSHCWIAGTIETSEGLLDDLEVAIIPIEILVPA